MADMYRGLLVAGLMLALPSAAAFQDEGVLRIAVALTGADQVVVPVRRHLLLISENPSSAPPRRVFTSADGTIEVRLRPGNYTVESDQPVVFEGRQYTWTRMFDVVVGRAAVLNLGTGNAEVVAAAASPVAAAADDDRSTLAARWQDSVVAIWSPTAHASGFVVDGVGLVVTHHYALGAASRVEVQLSSTRKVAGQVVLTDPARDVAVVRIDGATTAAVTPVALGCGLPMATPAAGDEVVAVEAPLRHPKGATDGRVLRVASRVIESDLVPADGAAGAPVFSTRGVLLGMTTEGDARMRERGADTRIVRTNEICDVVAQARTALAGAEAPSSAPLPVEPARPFPAATLTEVESPLTRHPPFTAASSSFDVAVLTPVHVQAGQQQRIATAGRTMSISSTFLRQRSATDFANWADYVADVPPVVFIRVTPKLVESFWMKIARGAAYTQGVALPAVKRPSSGFARMRVYCGAAELTPIHPFVLEVEGAGETITEGLYAFAPDALAPACGTVRLEIFSVKDPAKGEPAVLDGRLLEQVWADLAPYRALP